MFDQMQLVVDGIIYKIQATGGISRIFTEIIPRICDFDQNVKITILTSGLLSQQIPQHSNIRNKRIPEIDRYLHPAIFSRNVVNRIKKSWNNVWIGNGKNKIWHSTYYTIPEKWEGLQTVTVADMIHERFPELFDGPGSEDFKELKKQCILAADAVISISEATSRDVQQIYNINDKRIHVVHLACSDFFRPLDKHDDPVNKNNNALFFLYVGSRAHYKNFHGMITAYSRWKEKGKVKLLVVGPQWTRDEQKSLTELGIEDRVELLTDVRDESLCILYNQALAFIYPSLYEGFGIPLLEAMACGCPVIASMIDTTVEVAGECPIYFDLDDKDSIISAFDTAVSEGRESMRVREGLEHVKKYSWEKTARGTLDVYRSLY